jgi:hypothetical protein
MKKKNLLSNLILEEVRIARPLVLFKAFRHDSEIKKLLGIKKLRKRLFYDLADANFLIRGHGDIDATDLKNAMVVVERIKRKLRYESAKTNKA